MAWVVGYKRWFLLVLVCACSSHVEPTKPAASTPPFSATISSLQPFVRDRVLIADHATMLFPHGAQMYCGADALGAVRRIEDHVVEKRTMKCKLLEDDPEVVCGITIDTVALLSVLAELRFDHGWLVTSVILVDDKRLRPLESAQSHDFDLPTKCDVLPTWDD